MTEENAIQLVLKSLEEARAKHPSTDTYGLVDQGAVVAEEAGELIQACLNYMYEDGSISSIRKEACHTAATAIRLLMNLTMEGG